jgi:hypothetical protein
MNWLRVLGYTKSPQIDQHVGHQFHAIMPTLLLLKPQQPPLGVRRLLEPRTR